MLQCANCGKTINLMDLNDYFFENEEKQIIIKCNTCGKKKKVVSINNKSQSLGKYAISYTLLGFAFVFLFSFFLIMNPLLVLIAIILALITIAMQLLK